MTTRLLGGKVHGSLARAGKVKGQRSKVGKQEKKNPVQQEIRQRRRYFRQKEGAQFQQLIGCFFAVICAGQSGHCRFRVPFPESFCLCSLLLQLTSSNSLVPRVKSWRI